MSSSTLTVSPRGYVWYGFAAPSDVFNEKITNLVFGLYMWEWFNSLDFDWAFLTGKRKFKWPVGVYFACRYFMLLYVLSYTVLVNFRSPDLPMNCKVLTTIFRASGDLSVGLAGANLAIRTIAIWNRNIYVVVVLSLLMLGHIVICIFDTQEIVAVSYYNDGIQRPMIIAGCVSTSKSPYLRLLFLLALTFDFTVLVLNVYKIIGTSPTSLRAKMSTWRAQKDGFIGVTLTVVRQGVVFFFIAFCINAAQIVLLYNQNLLLKGKSRLFTSLAYVMYTIVSCRVVRSLATTFSDLPQKESQNIHLDDMTGQIRLSSADKIPSNGDPSNPTTISLRTLTPVSRK